MRNCGNGLAGRFAALAAASVLAGAAAPAAAGSLTSASLTLPFDVQFADGLTGNFGSVTIEERSHGKLQITLALSSELGPEADLHEFYFNLLDSLDVGDVEISHFRCRAWGESELGSCHTDFEIEEDPSVRGGAGSEFDFGVNFGSGGSKKGNGNLAELSFKLAAFADGGDDDDDGDRHGKDHEFNGKGKGHHEDDDDDDDGERIELTIADLLESSQTKSGLEVFFAAHVQNTDFSSGSDSETIGALVPEPGTAALFGLGLLGIAIAGRRRS